MTVIVGSWSPVFESQAVCSFSGVQSVTDNYVVELLLVWLKKLFVPIYMKFRSDLFLYEELGEVRKSVPIVVNGLYVGLYE